MSGKVRNLSCPAAIRRWFMTAVLVVVTGAGAGAEPISGGSGTKTLTLDEATRLAEAQSPVVQRAATTVGSTQADVAMALVPFHTSVTATANGTGQENASRGTNGLSGTAGGSVNVQATPSIALSAEANASSTNTVQTATSTQLPALSVSGSWNAWPPQSLSEDTLTLAGARADQAGSRDVLALAKIQAVLKARYDYQMLQIDIRRTTIAREAAASARTALEHDQANAKQNAISLADLLKSQSDEANARLELKKATDTEASDREALGRDIGMEPGQVAPDPWQGVAFTPVRIDEKSLENMAVQSDPEVLASQRKLMLAQSRATTARDRNNLNLKLQAGVEWPTFDSGPLFTVAVQGSYVFADGGKLKAAIDKATSEVAAAQLDLDAAEHSLADAISRQIDTVEEQALKIEALQYARDRARVLYLDAQSRAKAGAITPDDLAAGRRTYDSAQLDLDAAVVEYQYLGDSLMQAPGEKPL